MEIPFNLLILPFLGGYVFVRFFNYFRIHTLRSDKERLVIRSSLAGFASLSFVWFTHQIAAWSFPCTPTSICIPTIWRDLVPFEHSGIAVAAFLVAAFAWYPLNKLKRYDRLEQIHRAIREDADPLELTLKRSQDEGVALAITLINEKVYIGRVVHIFNPATPTNNIGLLPLQSGYRDPVTKQMYLKIDYATTMQKITEELDKTAEEISEIEAKQNEYLRSELPKKAIALNDKLDKAKAAFDQLRYTISLFSLVIPVNQISSVHVFDSGVHSKYFA